MNLGKLYSWSNYILCKIKSLPSFCDYLQDEKNTVQPQTWYEELSDKSKIEADKFLADHIIVHVKFASPEVEWNTLDARYTFYDQISNLGGTIGLSEQITGASFLTLIHMVVLFIKAIVRYISSNKH